MKNYLKQMKLACKLVCFTTTDDIVFKIHHKICVKIRMVSLYSVLHNIGVSSTLFKIKRDILQTCTLALIK